MEKIVFVSRKTKTIKIAKDSKSIFYLPEQQNKVLERLP